VANLERIPEEVHCELPREHVTRQRAVSKRGSRGKAKLASGRTISLALAESELPIALFRISRIRGRHVAENRERCSAVGLAPKPVEMRRERGEHFAGVRGSAPEACVTVQLIETVV
jgi:hypothetical protein